MDNGEIQFDQAEMQKASEQEEMERLQAENANLSQRVVLLRALVNRQAAQLADRAEAVKPTETGEGVEPQ